MRRNKLPVRTQSRRKYQVFADQLKLAPFLNKNLQYDSQEYLDIKIKILSSDPESRESLYKTGTGYYEKIRTENSFNHCKAILKEDGIEEDMREKVIGGAVVCSLIDYVLKPKESAEEIHHQILEARLEEYLFYLESPHRE
jgi:hypothetical protein